MEASGDWLDTTEDLIGLAKSLVESGLNTGGFLLFGWRVPEDGVEALETWLGVVDTWLEAYNGVASNGSDS